MVADIPAYFIVLSEDVYRAFLEKTYELHGRDLVQLAAEDPALAFEAFRECMRTVRIPNLQVTTPEGVTFREAMDGQEATAGALIRHLERSAARQGKIRFGVRMARRRWTWIFGGAREHPAEHMLQIIIEPPIAKPSN